MADDLHTAIAGFQLCWLPESVAVVSQQLHICNCIFREWSLSGNEAASLAYPVQEKVSTAVVASKDVRGPPLQGQGRRTAKGHTKRLMK